MNSIGGTNAHTLATEAAFGMVDIAEVVGDSDGLKLALLEAFGASDAGTFTGFHRCTTLVFIDAAHKDTSPLGAFFA